MRMKRKQWLIIGALAILASALAAAQETGSSSGTGGQSSAAQSSSQQKTSQPAAPEGIESGGYRIQQSVELGYRFTSVDGSGAVYNTFVNLHDGPRLLDQTLSMQSLDHTGLFDDLFLSSFGFGGDPNDAARLRASKAKWYNLTASYRRDKNYFDYDLLANPLNPPTSKPSVPVDQSPHSFYTARHMGDADLVLFPLSRVNLRLGYSHNGANGPSFSSYHQGTEASLFQPWSTTSNTWRLGFTVKSADRKTALSFDQFLQYFKNDTNYFLAPFADFLLSNGLPASLGLSWNTPGNAPCATPLAGATANPKCNGYLNYSRVQRLRTTSPTSQVTLISRAIPKLDFVGHAAYAWSNSETPLFEFFSGRESRTNLRQFNVGGSPARASSITATIEAGATYNLTDKLRLVDNFRFNNYRTPGNFLLNEFDFFGSSMLSNPALFPLSTPAHTSSSGPDIINELFRRFLGQDEKLNEFDVEYDLSRRAGVTVGYRFRHLVDTHNWMSTAIADIFFPSQPGRGNCAGLPLNANGTCTFSGLFDSENDYLEINQHTGVIGLWFRPTDQLRINLNTEFLSADEILTRIDPRHQQQYRVRIDWTPHPWLVLGANANIIESRDPVPEISYRGHNRSFGLTAMMARNERFGLDLAYNLSSFQQNANVCYVGTLQPSGTTTCVEESDLLQVFGFYHNRSQYGSATVRFKPVSRLTANLGYAIENNQGDMLILNPLQPFGSLNFNYHRPVAQLEMNVAQHVDGIVGWNYYDYDEQSVVGPTFPRRFHANLATVALRYSF